MMQDIEGTDHGGTCSKVTFVTRGGQHSLQQTPERLPECYVVQRKSTPYNTVIKKSNPWG